MSGVYPLTNKYIVIKSKIETDSFSKPSAMSSEEELKRRCAGENAMPGKQLDN
jgi:hypothetical protein